VFGQFLQLGNSTAQDSTEAAVDSSSTDTTSSSSSGDTSTSGSSSSSSKKKVATVGQPSGTGLGLSLCLRFVQRMNGHIWATNLPPR
jgi:light-regulated signal transduction histidine kinase (bacteriophytochrome)